MLSCRSGWLMGRTKRVERTKRDDMSDAENRTDGSNRADVVIRYGVPADIAHLEELKAALKRALTVELNAGLRELSHETLLMMTTLLMRVETDMRI